jgi:hypothetical protein
MQMPLPTGGNDHRPVVHPLELAGYLPETRSEGRIIAVDDQKVIARINRERLPACHSPLEGRAIPCCGCRGR